MAKDATEATRQVNDSFLKNLPFNKSDDMADVRRGLIIEVPDLQIKGDNGRMIWDMKSYYDVMDKMPNAPETVNPSYWRHERKETVAGLFEVVDGIWQVRGFDIANLTIIRSDHGYIVVDTLLTPEAAKAAMELAFKYLGKKPVVAVVITHTHPDHYNGLSAVVDPEDVRLGKIPVIVPGRFTEEVGNEGIFVGRAYQRRAVYQFGQRLPVNERGCLGAGLGKAAASIKEHYVHPNTVVTKTGEMLNIDGVEFVFQMTPHAEAPAEFCFYLPQFKALCMAELANSHLHNLLPIRGAQARSAKLWAQYLQEALVLFGDDAEVLFITHHWPIWGNRNIREFLEKQRDLYKFINDQTLRLMNHGLTMSEIAEVLQLPDSLGKEWYSRGYYGHLKHNVKATYQRYLGWYDCNPANLDALPPEAAGRKYVEFMGGPEETLRKARESYDKSEYRWAAMVLNHLVFGYPDNVEARELLADTYEQLGYQAECGTWRNSYLTGALELRQGPPPDNYRSHLSRSSIENLPTGLLLDYLAIHLDPAKADGKKISINLNFPEIGQRWNWNLDNSVLTNWPKDNANAESTYKLSRQTFDRIVCREMSEEQALAEGKIEIAGNKGILTDLLGLLEDAPNASFGIVTP